MSTSFRKDVSQDAGGGEPTVGGLVEDPVHDVQGAAQVVSAAHVPSDELYLRGDSIQPACKCVGRARLSRMRI